MRYSKELKAAVLRQMMPPGNEAIAVLAEEFNITQATLYAWRRQAERGGVASPGNDRVAEDWSGQSKLAVVLETASLSEAELAEYCRAKGLYREQIEQWKQQALAGFSTTPVLRETASLQQAKRLRQLESELRRKDRALAEAAALLVLTKKASAIWGDEDV